VRTIVVDVRMVGSSGIGTYVGNLVPRIMRARAAWRYCLLGSPAALKAHGWDRLADVEIIEFLPRVYSLDEQLRLVRSIPRGADLFWAPHYNVPIFYSGKLLVTVHDVAHLAVPQFFRGLHKRLYARTMFAMVRHKADRVICVSQFTKDEMARLVGMSRARMEVVHLGVDEGWFRLQPGDSPRPRPYILYVGNVKPHKNLRVLLDAFRQILTKTSHDLVIAGETDGFRTSDRGTMRAAEDLSDRVIFTGRIGDEELRQLIVNAGALVLPSLYEGFGLPPLEAMACGCPAVVSTSASLPEICGSAALYFDPYDERDVAEKVLSVIHDATLRENLREQGRRRAREFSWDKTTQATIRIIDEMLEA
jgi:glycosyltransferase involved in cell wall biosynthesis